MERARRLPLVLLVAVAMGGPGCDGDGGPADGGPDGAPDAEPPMDCLASRTIGAGEEPGPPPDGIGGEGDLEVTTDVLRAVFSAVDRPVQIAPTGGTLMDLHLLGGGDHLNELSQMAGADQALQVAYTEIEALEPAAGALVVEARGHVWLQPTDSDEPAVTPEPGTDLAVTTRYSFRCGEPRVWIESTLTNEGSVEYRTGADFAVMDLMMWGGNSLVPFCPVRGQGDRCAPFDVSNPLAGIVGSAYVGATGSRTGPPGTYAFYIEDAEARVFFGVHSEEVSSMGWFVPGRGHLEPGETRVFGRVLVVGGRADVASAVDLALEGLVENPRVEMEIGTVTGRVTPPAGETLSDDAYERPLVMLALEAEEGDPLDPEEWTPVTMARVEPDGTFSARVPAGEIAWELRARARPPQRGRGGRVEPEGSLDLGELAVPPLPTLRVAVHDVTSGSPEPLVARVIVTGADGSEDPMLGPDETGWPAENTAATDGAGEAELRLPEGTYDVWATHGALYSVARERVEVPAAGAEVTLELEDLGVLPEGFVTADLHVHSVASMDSSLPFVDRLVAYLAEGIDVVVATDHDVVTDYRPALAELEASLPEEMRGRLVTFSGVEATPSVPFEAFPHTLGHHNAYPLEPQPGAHAGGAVVDEMVDLATLYERLRAMPSPAAAPLVQMNHPRSSRYGSIWLGYLDCCGFDPTMPLDEESLCFAAVAARGTRPWDFDAIEVLNGKRAEDFVHYGRDWLGLLRLAPGGRRPVGTANSDSHRLVVDQAGYPFTVLRTDLPLEALDAEALVAAVESGAVAGVLGVFVWASAHEEGGTATVEPGRAPLEARSGRVVLDVRVAAAPWVRVDELRVRVDGEVVRRLGPPDLVVPSDPFGIEDVVRFEGEIDLSDLALSSDAFVTLEAGFPLARVGDLDGDGVVDATDNDGDGDVDEDDLEGGIEVGEPSPEMEVLAPGARAVGFTNPIYVDVDGDGESSPPRTPLPD